MTSVPQDAKVMGIEDFPLSSTFINLAPYGIYIYDLFSF